PHESSVPIAAIASLARANGVKVLLTGEGADELFGGYWFMHRGLYEEFLPRRARLAHAVDRLRRNGLRRLPTLVAGKLRRDDSPGAPAGAQEPREFERAVGARA